MPILQRLANRRAVVSKLSAWKIRLPVLVLYGWVVAGQSAWTQEVSPTKTGLPSAVNVERGTSADPASLQTAALPSFEGDSLPRDLSPWGMYRQADWVVKAVMIGLAFASVVTWTIWLAKTLELVGGMRRLRQNLASLRQVKSLPEAGMRLKERQEIVSGLVHAAIAETNLSADGSAEGLKERVVSRLERLEAAAARRMNFGTGVLATIGSTAPFVGLFGTVWGIMNSFIGISKAQTTNLAVVAPGIAEALLATALGLLAAIPAVVIYNHFARSISSFRALVADASSEVLRLVSRDLDRHGLRPVKIAN